MSILAVLLSSCSPLKAVNAFTPDSGSSLERGVAYGDHPRQRLDIYRPDTPSSGAAVIVFFYGGAWDSGHRGQYEFVARRLAAAGHFAVIPDYRLYPQVTFPGFVNDGARAAAYVMDHVLDIAGRPRPVFLMGHSAGAHIALLVALDPTYLSRHGHRNRELAGVIGLAGPYDFLPLTSRRLRKIFPTPEARHHSQPIYFVDAGDPPVFLAHGDRDRTVRPQNSINMADRIATAGAEVALRIYSGVGHAGVMKSFVHFLDDDAGLLDDVLDFVSAHGTRKAVEGSPML